MLIITRSEAVNRLKRIAHIGKSYYIKHERLSDGTFAIFKETQNGIKADYYCRAVLSRV